MSQMQKRLNPKVGYKIVDRNGAAWPVDIAGKVYTPQRNFSKILSN